MADYEPCNYMNFNEPIYGTGINLWTISTCGIGEGVCEGHKNYPENCSRPRNTREKEVDESRKEKTKNVLR